MNCIIDCGSNSCNSDPDMTINFSIIVQLAVSVEFDSPKLG